MHQWGDPHMDEPQYLFKIGDRARVRFSIPSYANRVGKVTSVEDGVTLEFDDGSTMTYDDDMLVKIKPE